jgi:hypothetical protein
MWEGTISLAGGICPPHQDVVTWHEGVSLLISIGRPRAEAVYSRYFPRNCCRLNDLPFFEHSITDPSVIDSSESIALELPGQILH